MLLAATNVQSVDVFIKAELECCWSSVVWKVRTDQIIEILDWDAIATDDFRAAIPKGTREIKLGLQMVIQGRRRRRHN